MRLLLAPDAFLRTYVGDRGLGWVLVRRHPGRRAWLDAVTRTLVELADGKRTIEQLAIDASERLGRPVPAPEAEGRLEPLVASGALLDVDHGWPAERAGRRPGLQVVLLDARRAARMRLEVAPGVGFDCDGRGGCCRLYDRVHLNERDVANLRSAYGDEHTPGGLLIDRALRRDRDDNPDGSFVLASVDGACVILEKDGKCGVHRRLGLERKPAGCRGYPLRDVLCEDELHVGVAVECRCVIDFADRAPILAAAQSLLARRRSTRWLQEVAAEVPATDARTFARSEYRVWREAALERVRAADDMVAWSLAECALLLGAEPMAPARLLTALRPILSDTHAMLALQAEDTAAHYSRVDLQRRLFAWANEVARRLLSATGKEPPQPGERLMAEQSLFTHGLLRGATLVTGLVALALRTLMARVAGGVATPRELLPVSTVEYLHRTHEMGKVVDDASVLVERVLRSSPS